MIRFFTLAMLGRSSEGLAAGALNYYHSLSSTVGLAPRFEPLVGSAAALLLCAGFGFYFSRRCRIAMGNPVPSGKFGVFEFFENLVGFVYDLAKEQCGAVFLRYYPLLGGLFIFILMANLSGLVPGFPPVTETFSANLALGAIVFLVYNYAGIREHGFSYIKQFMGPFLVLAPLFLVLESISHCARPLSLAFRLTANIFGDHLLLGVFSNMVPIGVPALLMCFGLLVAFIQSFVFTVLTAIYISMAISHDH